MNPWQCAQQLKYLLQVAVWPDGAAGPVFSDVRVTQGPLESASGALRYPLAIIRVTTSEPDRQNPGLLTERFEVVLAVAHAGDQIGEMSMIGGQRSSQAQSYGRGLMEVEERLRVAVSELNSTSGISVVESATSAAEAGYQDGVGYVATRAYTLDARLTTTRKYPTPNGENALTATGGVGTVSLSWAALTPRFDAHPAVALPVLDARGSFYLVRKSGSTAPSSVSDGTTVYSGGFSTSYSASVAAGTYTYGLFTQFDEFGDGVTSLRYSDTPAYATVTVT